MKFFFGVVSKIQIDTIIDYSLAHKDKNIFLIPSRRQVDYNGGYVNNWTTKEFTEYVKSRNPNIKIGRDHSGPSQGLDYDDGFESLSEDCKYFDIIHIDPWKAYPNLNDGIKWSISMINFCYQNNPNIEYEIGTEESIRYYTLDELKTIISELKIQLKAEVFDKIKYCVVQCGNSLIDGKNSGLFDKNKLTEMIKLVKSYNFISKEHNGDWVDIEVIKEKGNCGLECINIAPEFGMIVTNVILNKVKNNEEQYTKLYNLCFNSGKWKKWVSNNFDFENQKDELILITCHYLFSNSEFISIKENYINIDEEIKKAIENKLSLLYLIYQERKRCIFCKNVGFKELLTRDYETSINMSMYETIPECYFMPYNILICDTCNSAQNKYIGDLNIVYKKNHIDNYGTTKTKKYTLFSEFIMNNSDIKSVLEVGACNNILASLVLEINENIQYTIIEPNYTGCLDKLNIINDYFDNYNLNTCNYDTIIMSDVYEHFYEPISILEKLRDSKVKYIYLNHPDFDYGIKNNFYINLNSEHTFLIEHQFLFNLFEKYGFKIKRKKTFENFSLFLEFERHENNNSNLIIKNITTPNDVEMYITSITKKVEKINYYINNNPDKQFYIWPTSIHSIPLFIFGLEYKKLTGVLDNSPNKIGKYLYGYNLKCYSFNEILQSNNSDICVFVSCAGIYIKEISSDNIKIQLIFIDKL